MNDNNDIKNAKTWAEIAGPIVAKLHASSALGKPVSITPEGALSLARLMAGMARKLDNAGVKVLDNLH